MKVLAPPDFDPYRAGFLADPWEDYRRLRSAGPVAWHEKLQMWFVTGHAEAVSVLRDVSCSVHGPGEAIARLGVRAGRRFPHLIDVLDALPLFRNPPAHALRRRSVTAALGGRPVSSYAPDMLRIAERLLEQPRRDGGFDAVRDLAERMPALFLAEVLGIPAADVPALQETAVLFKAMNRVVSLGEYQRMEKAAAASVAYFSQVVSQRRNAPGADGISRMIAAELHGERLADHEIAPLCFALFLAGTETTSAFIGSAIRTLTEFPQLREQLRAEPSLLKLAVDELLRFESPIQSVSRWAGEARQLAGQAIEPGNEIVVVLASANRDEAAWPMAEVLDFRRSVRPHLAFGEGSHACVGGTLARMEGHAALSAWLRLPDWRRLPGEDRWWDLDWMRRLREFPVEFGR